MTEAIFAAAALFGVILYVTRPFWITVGGPSTGSGRTEACSSSVHGELVEPCKSDRFCTQCGEKNSKGSRFCGQCGKALLALLMLFISTTLFAADAPQGMAEAAGMPPHSKAQVGEIHGTLVKDGKPQANKQVRIQVQQDGQILLELPKQTDAKGDFVFKNIFKDPKFSYIILTEDEGKTFHNGPIQLSPKQDVATIKFEITPDKMVEMNAEPMPASSPRAMPQAKAPQQWQNQQMTSIVLSAIVLILLAFAFGRYQRKK